MAIHIEKSSYELIYNYLVDSKEPSHIYLCINALQYLALDDNVKDIMLQSNYVVPIYNHFINNLDTVEITMASYKFFTHMSKYDDIQRYLFDNNIVNTILESIAKYPNVPEFIIVAYTLLVHLATSERYLDNVNVSDFFMLILNVMQTYIEDIEVERVCVDALASICTVDTTGEFHFTNGYHVVLGQLIDKYFEDQDFVYRSLQRVEHMAKYPDYTQEIVKETAPSVLKAVMKFLSVPDICIVYAHMLASLLSAKAIHPELLEQEHIRALSKMSSRYEENTAVLEPVYECFYFYGKRYDCLQQFAASKVYDEFMDVFSNNLSSPILSTYLIGAFTPFIHIEFLDDEFEERVTDNIICCMQNFENNPDVIAEALCFFKNLKAFENKCIAEGEEMNMTIKNNLILPCFVKSFTLMPDELELAAEFCDFTFEYAKRETTISLLIDYKVIPCYVTMLRQQKREILHLVVRNLLYIVCSGTYASFLESLQIPDTSFTNCIPIIRNDGIDVLLDCLNAEKEDLQLIHSILELLIILINCNKQEFAISKQEAYQVLCSYLSHEDIPVEIVSMFMRAFYISSFVSDNIQPLYYSGVLNVIKSIILIYGNNNEILLLLLKLTNNLTSFDLAANYITSTCISTIFEYVELSPQPTILEIASQIAYALSTRSGLHNKLLLSPVFPVLIHALPEVVTCRNVQVNFLNAINCYTRNTTEFLDLLHLDVLYTVDDCLKYYNTLPDSEILQLCTTFFYACSETNETNQIFYDAQILGTILDTIDRINPHYNQEPFPSIYYNLVHIIETCVDKNEYAIDDVATNHGILTLLQSIDLCVSSDVTTMSLHVIDSCVSSIELQEYLFHEKEYSILLSLMTSDKLNSEQFAQYLNILYVIIENSGETELNVMKESTLFASLIDLVDKYVDDQEVIKALLNILYVLSVSVIECLLSPHLYELFAIIFEKYIENEEIVEILIHIIDNISEMNQFVEDPTICCLIPSLSDVLLHYDQNIEFVTYTITILTKISVNHECMIESIKHNAVKNSIHILKNFEDDDQLFYKVCSLLYKYSDELDLSIDQFAEDNNTRILYDGIFKFVDSPEILKVAGSLVRKLFATKTIGYTVITFDDVKPIRKLMMASKILDNDVRDEIVFMCLTALSTLCKSDATNAAQLMKIAQPQIVNEVVYVFNYHERRLTLIALAIISYLCLTSKTREAVHEADTVKHLIECANYYPNDSAIITNCLLSLKKLSQDAEGRIAVSNTGVDCITNSMRKFKDDKVIQYHALNILELLSQKRELKEQIGFEGGVEIAIRDLISFSDDNIIVRSATSVLALLIEDADQNLDNFIACGGLDHLMTIYNKYTSNTEVLCTICLLIKSLASMKDAREFLMENNMISLLVHMLENNKSVELVSNACSALYTMLMYLPEDGQFDVKEIPVIFKSFKIVLESSKEEISKASKSCLNTLSGLSASDVCKPYLVENDILSLLLEIIKATSDNIESIILAMGVFSKLSDNSESNCEAIINHKCFTKILEIMAQYPRNSMIQNGGVEMIKNMSMYPKLIDPIIKTNAFKAIIDAMLSCSFNRIIITNCCIILNNLLPNQEAFDIAKENDAYYALHKARKQYIKDQNIQSCSKQWEKKLRHISRTRTMSTISTVSATTTD